MSEITYCVRGCKVADSHAVRHPADHDCTGCALQPALNDSQVCDRCRRMFRKAVNDLADMWPDLVNGVSRTSGRGGNTGKVQTSGHGDVGDMWRPRVTDAIDNISDWSTFLGRLMTDATAGRWPTEVQLALRVAGRPDVSDWFMHHELSFALVDDALSWRVEAWKALQTDYAQRIPLRGTCRCEVMADTADGGEVAVLCNAALVAVLWPADLGRNSAILCVDHPSAHRVPKAQWAVLADDLERARQ